MMRVWILLPFLCLWHPFAAADDIVENSSSPQGKAMTLRFTEEVRFGADEDDEHYFWPLINSTVFTDKDHNIYVVDPKDGRCMKFDKEGTFLATVITKGQGPGELPSLAYAQNLMDGRFAALSIGPGAMPSIHYFNGAFEFEKSNAPKGFTNIPQTVVLSPDGSKMGGSFQSFDMGSGSMTMYSGVLSNDFKVVKTVSEFGLEINPQRFAEMNYLREFFAKVLKNTQDHTSHAVFDNDGNVYTAAVNRYEITKWSPDLSEVLMTIRRKHKPIPNPEANQRAMVEKILEPFMGFPNMAQLLADESLDRIVALADMRPVKNPIFGMIPMEDGHLLVVHDMDMISGRQTVDIFSPEGKFIGQKTMEGWAFMGLSNIPRMRFQHGKAVTLLADEEGDNRAVRYSYQIVPQ